LPTPVELRLLVRTVPQRVEVEMLLPLLVELELVET